MGHSGQHRVRVRWQRYRDRTSPLCRFLQGGSLVKSTARSLLFVILLAPAIHAQSRPQVLYVTQSAGFAHPVLPLTEEILPAIGRQHDAFDIDITRDASILTTDILKRYDAVVFYTTGELPMNADQRTTFLQFIRNGGGFVGIHSATDTFYDWPEYGELIGGYFDNHPWREEVSVRVEDNTHPATRHLAERFQINDEIYQFKKWSRDRVNVLMSLDTQSVDTTKDSVHRNDNDFALTWSHSYGEGRVFYTALGHEETVWQDDRFQRLIVNGIVWAIGDVSNITDTEWKPLLDEQVVSNWRGY
ncbi:MAG TPA: ThuA domain-containing protein, partial [Acidobacteria bacterium]|nr:ThuA domain-containing protein [Acidobacteriota bacterium]